MVLLPENVMFAFFFVKNVKKCPCVTYIYLYTLGHTRIHSLCRPHILLICCTKTPEFSHLHSHCSTLKTTLNHAPKVCWFLYQKPYHTNLCTPTISISVTVARIKYIVLIVFSPVPSPTFHVKTEVIVIHKALFLLIFLTIFTQFRDH